MKRLLLIACVFLTGVWSVACNRFEARHEQIQAGEQTDPKDKTSVARDTMLVMPPDTQAR